MALAMFAATPTRADDVSWKDVSWKVDATSGPLAGQLEAVGQDGVSVSVDGQVRSLPLDVVRSLARPAAEASPSTLVVTCTDGSTLTGTDIAWQGDLLAISHPTGQIELPIGRVLSIAWHDATVERSWQAALPAGLEADVIVVRKGNDFEFVECAITGITADTVAVVLDEETIPVKREKVLGLRCLRERTAAGPVRVRTDGGLLTATDISWTPAGMVIDGTTKLPAAALVEIDYAAGRTLHLATVPPERVEVDPFFGDLGEVDGLETYFRPRAVATPSGSIVDVVVRPRTIAVWRIPADSREFRTGLSATASVGAVPVVVISLDDREVFRGPAPRAGMPDGPVTVGPVAVSGARRLQVTVEYGSTGPASGAVVLHDPVLAR